MIRDLELHRYQYEMEGTNIDAEIAIYRDKALRYLNEMHPETQAEMVLTHLS